MPPIVIKGVSSASLLEKSTFPVSITITEYEHGVVSVEKSTGQIHIFRNSIQGVSLVSYNDGGSIPYDVFEVYLDKDISYTLACSKGTFDRVRKELFRL